MSNQKSITLTIPSKLVEEAMANSSERLDRENNIQIKSVPGVYTILMIGMEEIIKSAAKLANDSKEVVEVNLDSLMTIKIENRESENGDKEGNIIPSVECGPTFKLLVKNDALTEDID